MAKQGKVLPARRPRSEESLLIQSAESLGRVIGTLQRQLEKIAIAHHGDGDGAVHRPAKRAAAPAKKSAANGRAAARKKAPPRKKTDRRR